MQCMSVRGQLEAYVDGELSAKQAARVEHHLLACASCRAELARVQAVVEALESWPLVEEPADLTARVVAQVRQQPALPLFRLRWSDLAISLALSAAGLIGLFLWRYLTELGKSFLYRSDVYLRLEMWRLHLALWGSWFLEAGVLPWGLVIVTIVLALVLIPLMWSPVTWVRAERIVCQGCCQGFSKC